MSKLEKLRALTGEQDVVEAASFLNEPAKFGKACNIYDGSSDEEHEPIIESPRQNKSKTHAPSNSVSNK